LFFSFPFSRKFPARVNSNIYRYSPHKQTHKQAKQKHGAIIAAVSLKVVVNAMVVKMKYLFACLIIPIVTILLFAVFGIGALYFGVTNHLERSGQWSGQ
jgi:hypothetical protein